MIADLRRAAWVEKDFPPVVLVHLGSAQEGERFLEQRWPEVPAIADPEAHLYGAARLGRMPLTDMLQPVLWKRGLLALAHGHLVGLPVGDPKRKSGLFLVDRQGRALWSYPSVHLADHPDLSRLPEVVRSLLL